MWPGVAITRRLKLPYLRGDRAGWFEGFVGECEGGARVGWFRVFVVGCGGGARAGRFGGFVSG